MTLAAVLLQAATAFNLICAGASTATLNEPKTETTVYRVDVGSMRYCFDDCVNVLRIKSVTDAAITFEDGSKGADGIRVMRGVNRKTLAFIDLVDAGIFRNETKGVCKVAAFTGFQADAG